MRADVISLSPARARTLLSGMLVLLLVLVWQAAPGLRQSRLAALADRSASAARVLPATDSLKPQQTLLSAKAGEDRSGAEPPLAGTPPEPWHLRSPRHALPPQLSPAPVALQRAYSPLQPRAPPAGALPRAQA